MNCKDNGMLYDPCLRKDFFDDKSWYNEFLIFHSIGVCQVNDSEVAEIREALARFLFATRTAPGKEPETTYIMGNGAIDMNDMAAYIKTIHGEERKKKQHVYKIIVQGEYITKEKIEQALSGMGLTVSCIETGYNLDKELEPLPDVISGLASACRSTLQDGEFPDGWDSYHYLNKVIDVCDTDDVKALAARICSVVIDYEDNFTAETLTAELILFCGDGLI